MSRDRRLVVGRMSAGFFEATVNDSPGQVVFGPARNGTYLTFDTHTGHADRIPGHRVTDLVPAVIDVVRRCTARAIIPTLRGPATCIKTLGRGGTHQGPHCDSQGREWTP